MDADIEFGDVQESRPEVRLRPDRNKQFAIVEYESPIEGELPIFVDLDVMRDMEIHAESDTTVELGGVLLGGQYEDEFGEPFVVITDSLRAEHYEATKGSFKFTHETWEQITREREDFPEDLQMVGWYHTHPDWSVFLSGMDMFICDNFFNKPLDVALVIDPCRDDRGMFQWTGDPAERVRRTQGFYLISSRFRREELEYFAALLEGNTDMAAQSRFSNSPGIIAQASPPVVNITQPQSGSLNLAVLGMMMMQFLVLAFIGWRLLYSPVEPTPKETEENEIEQLHTQIKALADRNTEAQKVQAQMAVLRQVMARPGDSTNLIASLEEMRLNSQELQSTVAAHRVAQKEYQDTITRLAAQLKAEVHTAKKNDNNYRVMKEARDKLKEANSALKKERDEAKSQLEIAKEGGGFFAKYQWYVLSFVAVLLVAGGFGVGLLVNKPEEEELGETPGTSRKPLKVSRPESNNEPEEEASEPMHMSDDEEEEPEEKE